MGRPPQTSALLTFGLALVAAILLIIGYNRHVSDFRSQIYSYDVFLATTPNKVLASNDSEIVFNSDFNCMLHNVCVGKGNKDAGFAIHLFGNDAHVESILKEVADRHPFGFREYQAFELVKASNSTRVPSIQANSTAAITNRFVSGNCGHDLGDEAMAIFRLMQLFPDPPDRLTTFFLAGRPHACDKVLAPMAESLIISRTMMPGQLMCFQRVYVGTRSVNYMSDHGGTWENRMETLERDMKSFRTFYYMHAQVRMPRTLEEMDTILIMQKRNGLHLSNIGNRQEIAEFLRREFSTYKVEIITWTDYTMVEQIKLLSRTRAIISLPGSDIMNGIFLPDGGALVLYCRPMGDFNKSGFDTSNERKFWFDRVSYVHASTEDCNSTNVTYIYDAARNEAKVMVHLESLKGRLQQLGIVPTVASLTEHVVTQKLAGKEISE